MRDAENRVTHGGELSAQASGEPACDWPGTGLRVGVRGGGAQPEPVAGPPPRRSAPRAHDFGRGTRFFADSEVYELLAKEAVPELVRRVGPTDQVRVWVAGCGDGAEAYSLAILFEETFERMGRSCPVRIFATDTDPEAIARGRRAEYSDDALALVSEARKAKFFAREAGQLRVSDAIRRKCVLATHDLIGDPPLSALDLLFCPRMLAQLAPALQARVMPVLHCALRHRGFLLFGAGGRPARVPPDLFEASKRSDLLQLRREVAKRPSVDYGLRRVRAPTDAPTEEPAQSEQDGAPTSWVHPLTQLSLEDLQAALEELRTSTEELLYVNRELESLNTELQRKIGELNQAHAELGGLFSATPVATILLDARLHIARYTPAATQLFNLRETDLRRPITHLNPRFVGLDLAGYLARLLATREAFEQKVQSQDGLRSYLARGVTHTSPAGELLGVVLTFADVTALRDAERERSANEQRMRLANEAAGIAGFDLHFSDDSLRWAGDPAPLLSPDAPITKLSELLAQIHPEDAAEVAQALSQAREACGEMRLRCEFRLAPDAGPERWRVIIGQPLVETDLGGGGKTKLLRGVLMNTTQRKQAERAMFRSERMEALGMLAGGIAHDFNNLLQGIFGHVSSARDETSEETVRQDLDVALTAYGRATALSEQLLTFAKGGAPRRAPGLLNEIVASAARFALRGSKIAGHFDFQAEPWCCSFDSNQLARVFENLTLNARQAMSGGGELLVSSRNVDLSAQDVAGLAAGQYVHVAVTDRGGGISSRDLPRIFDPFFTTKRRGSGLGLATAYSIIRQHDGVIEAESELGRGSTFHVYLPRCFEQDTETAASETVVKMHFGRVLVMDDQDVSRSSVGVMLRSLGCEVTTVADGKDALEQCARAHASGRAFSAAFLDLTVPGGVGGAEIASALAEQAPQTARIAMSGYADDAIIARPQSHGFSDSIRKPMLKPDLVTVLQRALRAS